MTLLGHLAHLNSLNILACVVKTCTFCRPADAPQPSVQATLHHVGPLTPAQLAPCAITQQDFETAVKKVQPSVRREGFATTPDVTWSDVGSLTEVSPESHPYSLKFQVSLAHSNGCIASDSYHQRQYGKFYPLV